MDPKQFVWLVLAAGSLVLPAALWREARPRMSANPSLRPGYRRIIRGLAVCLTLPWLVMGAACLVGDMPFPKAFFRPANFGPWAWAFWAVAFGVFGFAIWWAIWGGGATDLARHPGALPLPAWSVGKLKVLIAGFMVFAILWNAGWLLWLA